MTMVISDNICSLRVNLRNLVKKKNSIYNVDPDVCPVQLFAILFFLMLITLGMGSAVGFMSAVSTTLCDSFPDIDKKLIAKVNSYTSSSHHHFLHHHHHLHHHLHHQ